MTVGACRVESVASARDRLDAPRALRAKTCRSNDPVVPMYYYWMYLTLLHRPSRASQ